MWYNDAWKYRKEIVIDNTKVSGNSDLTDFPVLVSITDVDLKHNAKLNGYDILFTDRLQNKLSHEIESYNPTTGTLVAWVRIVQLYTAIDTHFYIYYGNPLADDQSNPTGVWNSNFKGVYHLSDSSGTNINDSTSNNFDLTKLAAATPAPTTSGKIGSAQSFAGNDHINAPSAPALPVNGSWTIDFWVNPTSFTNGAANDGIGTYFLDRTTSTNGLPSVKAISSQFHWQKRYDNGSGLAGIGGSLSAITNGQWRKITLVRNYNSTLELRVDGVQVATAVDGTLALTVPALRLGRHESGVGGLTGFEDELRLVATNLPIAWSLTEFNNQNSSSTFYSIGSQEVKPFVQKHYIYRIYDDNIYVGTWTKEVISEPRFKFTINGGPGQLIVELDRDFDDFGEDVDVKLNNKVECWCVDKDSPNGVLLYAGYISGYRPIVRGATEKVEITVLGYIAEFQRIVLRDGSGNTTLTYNSYDPANMLKDIIDKLRTLGCSIAYSATSIQATNTSVSYTFNTNTGKEALDKIVELCPDGWYWRVDPDGIIYLRPRNLEADHQFALGYNVEDLETHRRIEDVTNRVFFVGAGSPALFRKYENSGSVDSYGPYEKKVIDQRVSVVATAQALSDRQINQNKDPEIRSTFVIIDNNGPQDRGYNIESVKPGQTLKVKNLKAAVRTVTLWDVGLWDVDVWDQTLATAAADVIQILSVDYTPDSIVIEASSRLPQIAKRIEDIQRNLEVTQMVNNPTAPS